MRSFIQKHSSQQIEEFNLNDMDNATKKLRPPIGQGPKNGLSPNHYFIPKNQSSRNGSKKRRWYSRKQKINTNNIEMETTAPLNNTIDDDLYSDDGKSFSFKRMCHVSKKTELLLGRFTLISTIILLVAVTNFGSLSIYVPSVTPKNNTGNIKALARNTLTNDAQANEGVSFPLDNIPKLDATNPNREKMTNSRTLKNTSLPNCYESVDEWDKTLMNIRFALDSVLLPVCGILGMLSNIIVIITLIRITRKKSSHENHKNFDRLIIFLSIIDFWLIFFYVVDALIQIDIMTEPQFYQVIFPHVWHPTKAILTTASQYMVLAVSAERFIAICHYPLESPKYFKIFVQVIIFSITVNFPRFFEFIRYTDPKLEFSQTERKPDDQFSLQYHTSRLGENPKWVYFISIQEIAKVFFCLFAICYCNIRVWFQVRCSTNLNIQRHIGTTQSSSISKKTSSTTKSISRKETIVAQKKSFLRLKVDVHVEDEAKLSSTTTNNIEDVVGLKSKEDTSIDEKLENLEQNDSVGDEGTKYKGIQNLCVSRNLSSAKEGSNQSEHRRSSIVQLKASGEISIEIMQVTDNNFETSADLTPHTAHQALRQQSSISKCSTTTSPDHDDTRDHFRKQYNKSTRILFYIALMFLICNIPRLAVKIFNISVQGKSVQKDYMNCFRAGQYHTPVAISIMIYINHLLLVVNSSTNFIVYTFLSKRFRNELQQIIKSIKDVFRTNDPVEDLP